MVVSAHSIASIIGTDILKKGGNAADATVAVHFALAVVYPSAGNIGGGGFFVYRTNKGEYSSLDFREKAPLKSSRNMYLDSNNEVIEGLSTNSHLAVGVPGSVDGMVNIHDKYGELSWEELIQPSIDLASNGFVITKLEADKLNNFNNGKGLINDNTEYNKPNYKPGDSLSLPNLAKTLIKIRDYKRSGFYSGEVALMLIDQMKVSGGIINQQDLDDYKSIWRKPIISTYKNFKIISMGPPSSGGIILSQMLKMAEKFPIRDYGFHSKNSIHLMTEIEKLSFADRAKYLGDPDFWKVPENQFLDSAYLMERVKNLSLDSVIPSSKVFAGKFNNLESNETTHFSIVDSKGNASAVTTTLNGSFGSGIVVSGAGFLLNNEMDDFSIQPGYPNMYGLVGGEANSIKPNKRMLSSMTPTIIEKDDKLFLVLGSPGGSTIITAVFQTIINVIDHQMGIQEAVNAPRFHHQWFPDEIKLETKIAKDTLLVKQLKDLNHKLNFVNSMNRVDAILIKNNKLFGGADYRGDDMISSY
jgi:gamma-glutamyltranspeptidase/glutathione hydrolase